MQPNPAKPPGVRPSSGAATSEPPRDSNHFQAFQASQAAAPGDGRAPRPDEQSPRRLRELAGPSPSQSLKRTKVRAPGLLCLALLTCPLAFGATAKKPVRPPVPAGNRFLFVV